VFEKSNKARAGKGLPPVAMDGPLPRVRGARQITTVREALDALRFGNNVEVAQGCDFLASHEVDPACRSDVMKEVMKFLEKQRGYWLPRSAEILERYATKEDEAELIPVFEKMAVESDRLLFAPAEIQVLQKRLVAFGDAESLKAVARTSTRSHLWDSALKALGTSNEDRILALLQDADERVVIGAMRLLAGVGTEKSLAKLAELKERQPQDRVTQSAGSAHYELQRKLQAGKVYIQELRP
jgi:hypothetical protein